jgi:ribosomal protein L14
MGGGQGRSDALGLARAEARRQTSQRERQRQKSRISEVVHSASAEHRKERERRLAGGGRRMQEGGECRRREGRVAAVLSLPHHDPPFVAPIMGHPVRLRLHCSRIPSSCALSLQTSNRVSHATTMIQLKVGLLYQQTSWRLTVTIDDAELHRQLWRGHSRMCCCHEEEESRCEHRSVDTILDDRRILTGVHVGDRIIVVVQKQRTFGAENPGGSSLGITNKVRRGDIRHAVVVRARKEQQRKDGSLIKFDDNACVLINKNGDPIGTRLTSVVGAELRNKQWSKILSLAPLHV